ncbi:MAG: DUF6314 family protein [Solirubrobacteraceae bacterium]|nr:DUF6314 family protein [Solirubrobacteraceae bacterium]
MGASPDPATPDPSVPVPDPLRFLPGSWSLDRTIEDHAAGRTGTVDGRARFVPDGDGLRWIEEGTLRLGGYVGDGAREMRVRPDGATWAVDFDDGRPFHPLDLRTGSCAVEHPCRADLYRGELRATGPDELRVTWRIGGPAKDLTITTVYRRTASSAADGRDADPADRRLDPGPEPPAADRPGT